MADVVIERDFPGSRAAVFEAFTRPESLQAWFWPPRFETEVAIDLRESGGYSVRSAPVGMGFSGNYRTLDAPESLAFDWRWDGEDRTTDVRIDLRPNGEVTRLHLIHSGFPTDEERDNHTQGWNDCLDRLVLRLHAE